MPTRVEPPVLLSRLMMFVFASALVVLGVLGVTLWQMFPLNRPQVFFLTTQVKPDMEVRLYSMPPDNKYIEAYKTSFIKEYVKARNEITNKTSEMRRKWANSQDGVVNMWSTPDVYNGFTKTAMWNALMYSDAIIDMTCTVEFPPRPVTARRKDGLTYTVNFNYLCTNSNGQTSRKEYTIIVELEKEDNKVIEWSDRLNNPLGIHVKRYEIETGDGDPLNFE